MGCYETAKSVCDFIKTKITDEPKVAIVCGSGLGTLAEVVTDKTVISYSEIKEFPKSTGNFHIYCQLLVAGHAGNLVFGKIGGKNVVVMQGRFHPYEGFDLSNVRNFQSLHFQITLPIRVMKLLGAETLIATNAAGGLNESYNVGDIMIIEDHISLLGITGKNPLTGPNDERYDGFSKIKHLFRFGPRFPALAKMYTKSLRIKAKEIAKEMGYDKYFREGTYIAQSGPCYETPAEVRLMRLLGADAVGTLQGIFIANQF